MFVPEILPIIFKVDIIDNMKLTGTQFAMVMKEGPDNLLELENKAHNPFVAQSEWKYMKEVKL